MLRKFLPFKAPLSWYFTDPDTGHKYHADSRAELVKKILAYREQNELEEIFRLDLVIDHYLCLQPENIGKCGKNPEIHRSIWQYMQGGIILLRDMLIKEPVAKEVADKRASVCVGCKHNVFPDKGKFIKWSDRVAEASAPGKKSKFHNELGNCEVCTCPLRASIWSPSQKPLTEDQKIQMKEVGCWQVSKD